MTIAATADLACVNCDQVNLDDMKCPNDRKSCVDCCPCHAETSDRTREAKATLEAIGREYSDIERRYQVATLRVIASAINDIWPAAAYVELNEVADETVRVYLGIVIDESGMVLFDPEGGTDDTGAWPVAEDAAYSLDVRHRGAWAPVVNEIKATNKRDEGVWILRIADTLQMPQVCSIATETDGA